MLRSMPALSEPRHVRRFDSSGLFIGYLWTLNFVYMDRFYYVYDILAAEYTPPDVYECVDEPGVFCGDYPDEVNRFIDMAKGRIESDFPCSYEKFCADSDIMNIVDSYNKRIGENGIQTSDGKKILQIDKEALYYGAMFVYYLTEKQCTNAKRSPDTIRQQLLNLRDSLSDAKRVTLVAESLETGKDGERTYEYISKEPVRICDRAIIANLVHCIDELLQKDSLYSEFDSFGIGTGLERSLDSAEIDLYSSDDRVTYAPTRKAWIAMNMLKYLFGQLNLPDLRARKCLDRTEYDDEDNRSYSINRLVILLLNLMRYTDSRDEKSIKSLKSKYKDFDPNTVTGF